MKTSIKSLSESVKQLRFVLDEIKGFALILFDSNYKYHLALGEALEVAGYDGLAMEGKTLQQVFDPPVVDMLKPMYDMALNGDSIDLPFTGNNHVDYFVKIRPVKDDSGVSGGILLIHQEKSFEHKLLEQFSEVTTDSVTVVNAEGEIVFANNAICKQLGLRIDELKGSKVIDIEEKFNSQEDWDKHFKEVKEKKELTFSGTHVRANGEKYTAEIHIKYIQFNDQEFVHAISRDVTDRMEAERKEARIRELQSSLDFRKVFLTEMSHELRTPLNGILGLSEFVKDVSGLDENTADIIETIYDSAHQLDHVVDNVLNISKLERGEIDIAISTFRCKDFAESYEPLFQKSTRDKGIELDFEWPSETDYYINSDQGRIKQILNNILSNAIKYSNDGTITVKTQIIEGEETLLKIQVKDQGIGMTPDEVSKLTEMFERFDNAGDLAQQASGTGIGMWITKRIIDEMKGELKVVSEKGGGTLMEVSIPVSIDRKVVAKSKVKFTSAYQHAAVIDDKNVNLKVASLLLKNSGLSSHFFESGQAILDADKSSFDVMFLDIMMPEMDGFETLKKLREQGLNLPIIALTANNYQGYAEKVKQEGFDGFIAKPVTVAKIQDCLKELVKA